MGIEVNRSAVLEKTNQMDQNLEAAGEAAARSAEVLKQAAGDVMLYFKGMAWKEVSGYIYDVQIPLNRLYLHWIEAQTEGNRRYRQEAACLPLNEMIENDILERLNYYRRALRSEKDKEEPSEHRIRYYEQRIDMHESHLDRLHTFVQRTAHVYEEAASLLQLLGQADTELAKVTYWPEFQHLDYSQIDAGWLNAVNEKNAEIQSLKEMRLRQQQEDALTLEEIQGYWERTDGYFGGNWWQDEKKLAEATFMIMAELKKTGKMDLLALSMEYEEKGIPNNRLLLIQALANSSASGEYDSGTITMLENNLAAMGMNFDAMERSVDYAMLEALSQRYREYPGYALYYKHLLENGIQWRRNGDRDASRQNLTEEQKKAVAEYDLYWERQDGYFSGNWWQDEEKVKEAAQILREEMELRGEIDLILLAEEYENRGMGNQRLITIQTLANSTKTGSYDPNTVNSLENNLLAKGIIYQTREHSLTAKDIQALTARYGEYPEGGKKFTHFLENGGDMIFTGAEILAGGVLDRLKDIEENLDDVEELISEEKLESIENIEELISEEDIFGQGVQGEGGAGTPKTIPQQLTQEGKTPVIGKMKDLNTSGNVVDGEFKIADYLPDMGNPKANWHQNSGILRSVMNEGVPIKDVSTFPMDNAGFLGAERNLLQSRGWTYFEGYWYPPK